MSLICLDCKGECKQVNIQDGFYYDYGSISGAWHDESYAGSSCCGAEVVQGKVFLDKSSWHKASKDHTDNNGKVVVKKGEYYLARIIKGYYIEDGTHKPIIEYYKRPKRYFSPEMLNQLCCPELTPTPTH